MRKIYVLFLTLLITTLSNAQILTESFDGATFPPTGWTSTIVSVGDGSGFGIPGAAWARVTSSTSPTATPHSGAGMAYYNSFDFDPTSKADLITPALNFGGGQKQVRFWMYRSATYTNQDSVAIYVNTTNSGTGATYLGRVVRVISVAPTVPSTGWYEYTFVVPASFNGATNHIIFRGCSEYGLNMMIDDVVVENVPSCLPPSALTNSGITFTTANHSWTAATPVPSNGYEWAVTTSATPPSAGNATAGITASSTGLTANTNYFLHVRSNCGGSFSSWATSSFFTGYCTPAPTSVDGNGITNVTFGTINNTTGAETGNYGDYTAQSSSHFQSSSVPIAITFNTVTYDYNTSVWIDFNDNLIFENTEIVATGVSGTTSPNTLNLNMLIPASAPIGSHRLRIGATDDAPPPGPCYTGSYGAFEDYIINITAASGCTGTPTAGTISGPAAVCSGSNFVLTNSGATSGLTGLQYAWQVSTDGGTIWNNLNNSSNLVSPYTVSQLVASKYRFVDTCTTSNQNAISNIIDVAMTTVGCPPVNDECSNAITVVMASTCTNTSVNTTLATLSSNSSGCWSTSNNDDVWYKFVATNSTVVLNVSNFIVTGGTATSLGYVIYNEPSNCSNVNSSTELTTSCPTVIIASGIGSNSFTGLTVGNTYYLRLFTSGVANSASFDFCLTPPPPPPSCTTNVTPANNATGVGTVATGIPLTWNAAPGATSYDLYFGTTNPPTTNIANIAGTTTNVTGTSYFTTYYWYVVPINAGGSATGCNTNTTTFTTENAPTNCVPLYSTGCTSSDRIELFRLKGETSELNINTGTTCPSNAYTDTTDHSVIIDLARGKSYWGQVVAGTSGDYLTLWLDANDNGLFENTERIMNNLALNSATPTNINLLIDLATPAGNHKLRARLVYYSTPPTTPTDPCGSYTYSETEDYLVNIVGGGASYAVSSYTPTGACYDGIGQLTVDPASNNSSASYIPIVDSLNNIVAQIYPDGNDLGTVSANYYINNGPIRQTATGQYYLDRNYTISVAKQPTSTYRLRLHYKTTELNAIIAQPGSGVTSQFDLNMTKITSNICLNAFAQQSPVLVSTTGFGSIGADKFLDFVGLTSFSTFFLHAGAVLLPVSISNIRGEVTGATNTVYWTTATEANNRKFVVERSVNGNNFTAIGEVATRAINGNSNTALQYSFVDANPVQGKAFYRLQMVDINARATHSQIVTLRRGAGKLEIVDVRPNPTTGVIYFNLLGVNNSSQFTLTLRTIEGKALIVKNNFTPLGAGVMDMGNLANGMYILEAVDVRSNEKAVFKVVKQ